jgi:hypothetical protein
MRTLDLPPNANDMKLTNPQIRELIRMRGQLWIKEYDLSDTNLSGFDRTGVDLSGPNI